MRSLITGMLLAFILIASTTSCDRNAAQRAAAKAKPVELEKAKVQLAFYSEVDAKWKVNQYAPVKMVNIEPGYEIGDIISPYINHGDEKYMILAFPESFRGEYSFNLLNSDSIAIHNNMTNTTIGIIRGSDNPTLDSLLIYDND